MKLTTIASKLMTAINDNLVTGITYIGTGYTDETGTSYFFTKEGLGEFYLEYSSELDMVTAEFGDYCEVITSVQDVLDLA